ncbi:MAG: rhombosortase [Gammaproteobacteria bacterium]|nr:rhombosortase [Gammaproteobacteria bacterium]
MNATTEISLVQRALAAWWPVLALAAAALLLGLGGDAARAWGRYEREALESGELWRLLSAHLVHLGGGHLMLNVAALFTIRFLLDDLLSAADWIGAAVASALAIDAGLYFLSVEVGWYVGLSGVLHGLLAAGAIAMLRVQPGIAGMLVVGLVVKLAWEQAMGPLPFTQSASGGPVIVAAHLYGAAGGAAYALLRQTVRGRQSASL